MSSPSTISRSVVISPDGLFRYRLDRWWSPAADAREQRMPFMMLNPSIADSDVDDPTIRRCMAFARREGYSGITVVNIGAFRATDPRVWRRAADPFGPENLRHIDEVTSASKIVMAAWGADPLAQLSALGYLTHFAGTGIPVFCLGTTKDGHPRHPLYVPGDQPLIRLDADPQSIP
ncbi:MAG: DUF1643 domain-containing protein [Nakamurella sp.]